MFCRDGISGMITAHSTCRSSRVIWTSRRGSRRIIPLRLPALAISSGAEARYQWNQSQIEMIVGECFCGNAFSRSPVTRDVIADYTVIWKRWCSLSHHAGEMKGDPAWNPFYARVLFARQLDPAVRKCIRSLERSPFRPAISHNRCNYEQEIHPCH